jgi:putative pyruvate formate lyase activating enzyme
MDHPDQSPAYTRLAAGELSRRAALARQQSSPCTLCPRRCQADRGGGAAGKCGVGALPRVSSAGLHHGEEAPISGWQGSGTLFFSGCNLHCIFCQNHSISHLCQGEETTPAGLARTMVELQGLGAHNLNLVTPSHMIWPFLKALSLAVPLGLHLPIVYNSSGYDSPEALSLLDGLVDIYMPDLKFGSDALAAACTAVEDYWGVATAALVEMHRQVGVLRCNPEGLAERGLLIRHLVLPGDLAGTGQALEFIARQLGQDSVVSLMRQYHPCHRAFQHPPLDRTLAASEWDRAVETLERCGLSTRLVQGGWDRR